MTPNNIFTASLTHTLEYKQRLDMDMERVCAYIEQEIDQSTSIREQKLLVAEFGLLDAQLSTLLTMLQASEASFLYVWTSVVGWGICFSIWLGLGRLYRLGKRAEKRALGLVCFWRYLCVNLHIKRLRSYVSSLCLCLRLYCADIGRATIEFGT